ESGCGRLGHLRRRRRHHDDCGTADLRAALRRPASRSTHSRGFERRLPALGRGGLYDHLSRSRVVRRTDVFVGDGTAAEGPRRADVHPRLHVPSLTGVVPALRGQRRHARARHTLGARDHAEYSYFSSSFLSIGFSAIRTHWMDPYFANNCTFASMNWLLFSMSWRV